MTHTSEIKEVMVWLACASHGSDVEDKSYGEMADAMLIELNERGYEIVKKKGKSFSRTPQEVKNEFGNSPDRLANEIAKLRGLKDVE